MRRRYFSSQDMMELKAQRNKCRALDDRFTELRVDRVTGEGKSNQDSQVDVEPLLNNDDETYSDRFEEGTFHESWAFAEKRRLQFKR